MGFLSGLFGGGPKIVMPPAPPPPANPPTVANPAVAQALMGQRRAAAGAGAAFGGTVTNQGGAGGLAAPVNQAPKSLLGG